VKVWIFKGEILEHDPMAQDRRTMEAGDNRERRDRDNRDRPPRGDREDRPGGDRRGRGPRRPRQEEAAAPDAEG
jgi:small subunit ribosomal protein S3